MTNTPLPDQESSSLAQTRRGSSIIPRSTIHSLEERVKIAKQSSLATLSSRSVQEEDDSSTSEGSEREQDTQSDTDSYQETIPSREMADQLIDERALGDYAQPIIPNSPSCILLSQAARNYELKSSHFSQLPSFYGLPNENPLAHIKEFYVVVNSLPLQNITENELRMRIFPHTLKDKAKTWLMTLEPSSLTTWDAVNKKFLEKWFSPQKTAALRGQIFTFSQPEGESLNESWERFKNLMLECPHHGLPLHLQIQIFL